MTLYKTGSRGLIAAVFGPATKGETDYARDLADNLNSDMLLRADTAFDSNELLADIARQVHSSWFVPPASDVLQCWPSCPTAPTSRASAASPFG